MGKHRKHSGNFERGGKLESCSHGGVTFDDATLQNKKTSRSSYMSETPIVTVAHSSFSEEGKNKETLPLKEDENGLDSGSEILYSSFRSKKKSKKRKCNDISVQECHKELNTSAISNDSSLSEIQKVKKKKIKSPFDLLKVEKIEMNSSRNSILTSDSSNLVYEHSQSLLSRNITKALNSHNNRLLDLTQDSISTDYSSYSQSTIKCEREMEKLNSLDGFQLAQYSDEVFPKKRKKKHKLNENVDLTQESVQIDGDSITSENEVGKIYLKKKKKSKLNGNVPDLTEEQCSKWIKTETTNCLDGLQPTQSGDEVFSKKKRKKHRLNETVDLTSEINVDELNSKNKSKVNGNLLDLTQEPIETESRYPLDRLKPAQSSDAVSKKKKKKHRMNDSVDLTQESVVIDGDIVTSENEVGKINSKKKKSKLNVNVPDLPPDQTSKTIKTESINCLDSLQPDQIIDEVFPKKKKKKHKLKENVNLAQESVSLDGDTVTSENKAEEISPKKKKSKLNGNVLDLTPEQTSKQRKTESINCLDRLQHAQSNDEVFPKKKKKKHKFNENVDLTQESVSIDGDTVKSENDVGKMTSKKKKSNSNENVFNLTQEQTSKRIRTESGYSLEGLQPAQSSDEIFSKTRIKKHKLNRIVDLTQESAVRIDGDILTSENEVGKIIPNKKKSKLNRNAIDLAQEPTSTRIKIESRNCFDRLQPAHSIEDDFPKKKKKKHTLNENVELTLESVSIEDDTITSENNVSKIDPKQKKKSKLNENMPSDLAQEQTSKRIKTQWEIEQINSLDRLYPAQSSDEVIPKKKKHRLNGNVDLTQESINIDGDTVRSKNEIIKIKKRKRYEVTESLLKLTQESGLNKCVSGTKTKENVQLIPTNNDDSFDLSFKVLTKKKKKNMDGENYINANVVDCDTNVDHVSDVSFREKYLEASTPKNNKELGSKFKLETLPDEEQSNRKNVEESRKKTKGMKNDTKEHDQKSNHVSDFSFRERSLSTPTPNNNKDLGSKSKLETTIPDKEQSNSGNVVDSINKSRGKKKDSKEHDQKTDHVSDVSFRKKSLEASTPNNKKLGSKLNLKILPDKDQCNSENDEDRISKTRDKKRDSKELDQKTDRVSDASFREKSLETSTPKNNKEPGGKSKLETTIPDKDQSNSENVEESVNKTKGKKKDTREHDQKTIINGLVSDNSGSKSLSTKNKELKQFTKAVLARKELLMTDDIDEGNESYDSADDQSDYSLTENVSKIKQEDVSDSFDAYEYHLTEADKMVLGNLYVQVDFKVPPLHCIAPRATRPTKFMLEEVAKRKIPVKKGKFSKEEDEIWRANWKEFVKKYKIEDKPCLFFSFRNNAEKFFSDSNKIKFLLCLARGLDDRFLSTVYRRFKLLNRSTMLKSGRFTEVEDQTILEYLKKSTSKTKVRDLANILNRTIASLEKRIERLTRNKYERTLRWSKRRIQIYVKNLLIVTKSRTVEDMRHRTITLEEWKTLSKKLDGIPWQRLQIAWETCIYPRLFIENHLDMRRVKMEVVERMYKEGESDWKTVNWDRYVSPYKGLTARKLYVYIKTLVSVHIPSQITRNDLGKSLKILKKTIRNDPSIIRMHYLNKLVYEDGVIKELPGFKNVK